MSTVPPNTHRCPGFQPETAIANLIDKSNDFVTWDTGKLSSRKKAILRERIAMTNSARLHFDADLPKAGFRDIALERPQILLQAPQSARPSLFLLQCLLLP